MSAHQPPEPLAALAALEDEIDAIRAEVRDTAAEWQSLFLWDKLGKSSIASETLTEATTRARALVAREQHLAERRRALNERLAPAAPQPAPVEPKSVKAERGKVKAAAEEWIDGRPSPLIQTAGIEAFATKRGVKLKSLRNAIAAMRFKYDVADDEPRVSCAPLAPMPASAYRDSLGADDPHGEGA